MSELLKQNLNDGWVFQESGKLDWVNATVPGCVHIDLLENELISEPFYGTNEKDLQWVSEKDWIYKLIFEPKPGLLNQKKILLKFNGLDTYAEVLLNDGCFSLKLNLAVRETRK